MNKIILFALSCAIGLFSPAQADTIQLSGIVRDFKMDHPDFERDVCGQVTGLVSDTLGVDGKPLFGPNGTDCIKSSSSFAHWYNDSSVSHSAPFTVTLDNGQATAGGIYSYINPAFFPIDRDLFGNEGKPHNYHFTYELHSFFTYKGAEIFTLNGDDDLWVYINGKLAIDLGGIHKELNRTVNMDSLGLTVGTRYPIDIFFAERHAASSIFGIQTSLTIEPTPDVTGCIKMKTAPIRKAKVLARQQGESDQMTSTDGKGCYQFDKVVSGKPFQVIINGPRVP